MTIEYHLEHFAGKPVELFDIETGLSNVESVCYRLTEDYDGPGFDKVFQAFINDPKVSEVSSLVIGMWVSPENAYENGPEKVIAALVEASDKLPKLRALFLGDITYEENEISWIYQCDISPLFTAFPKLEMLRTRGSDNLSLGHLEHVNLHHLALESGGLDEKPIRQICQAVLPNLQHLELWLGSEYYGWNGNLDDLEPILHGDLFPKLRYLGLRDCEKADELAQRLIKSPIIEQLEVLDLSLGNLGDKGGAALLQLASHKRLRQLNLEYHYLSNEMMEKLAALPFEVNLDEQQEPDGDEPEDRYIAVSE